MGFATPVDTCSSVRKKLTLKFEVERRRYWFEVRDWPGFNIPHTRAI